MIPPRACPTPERCEILGCQGTACRPQALARTPPPIPLHLRHLSAEERGSGLVRLTETLRQWLRPRPADAAPSAPFLSIQDTAMSEYLAPAHIEPVLTPEPPAKPLRQVVPPLPQPRPLTPVQIVPVARGGFVLVVDGNLTAVAQDAKALGVICQEWASGAYLQPV